MTLPEFAACMRRFAEFHGLAKDPAPSDADYFAFLHDSAPRASIVH